MRIPHRSLLAVYIPFFATHAVVVSCGPLGEDTAVVGEKQDTLLASPTNCKPTRGVVGRRSTSYTAPPSNYLYVSKTGGSDPAHCVWGGAGNPFLSLKRAIQCVPVATVTTIVVKTGDYEEGELRVPATKTIRLQRNGTDVVTFWGSRLVPPAEWTSVPNPPAPLRPHWTKTIPSGDPSYTLVNRPWSPTSTCSDNSCWSHLVDPPEQVFIGGQALTQVRTVAEVAANKFFYDSSTRTYYVGSNPGSSTRISYRNDALMIDGAGSAVRGITFKQYGSSSALHAAVYGRGSNQTFEDNLFTQNNAAGLSVYADQCIRTANAIVRNNEFSYNGQMGLHVSCTNQAKVLNNRMHHNRWYAGWNIPAHGGMKSDRTQDLIVKNNDALDNLGQGLWLDIYSNDARVVGNRAYRNSGIGLFFETSQRAMLVNNRAALNQEAGIWVANSSDARVYNNALANNGNGRDPAGDDINDANIAIISQYSRLPEPAPHTRNVTIKNNVSSMQNGQAFNLHVYAHAIGYVPGVNATGDNPPDGNDLNDFNVRTDRNAFWRYAPQDQPFTADPLFHWAFRAPTGTTHKKFVTITHVKMPHSDVPGQERPGQELTTPLPAFDKAGPVDPFLVPGSWDSKGGALLNAGVDLDDDMAAEAGVVKACGKNVGPFTFQ